MVSQLIDNLPGSGAKYNIRAWEIQCCNLNGLSVEEWYWMRDGERTWKVAAMLLPNVMGAFEAIAVRRASA